MIPREAEVLSALKLIHDTPIEILIVHRELAMQTWRQVGRVFDACCDANETIPPGLGPGNADRLLERGAARTGQLSHFNAPPEECNTGSQANGPLTPSETTSISLPSMSSASGGRGPTRKRKRPTEVDLHSKLMKATKRRLPGVLQLCKSKTSLSEILQNEQEMQFADKRIDHLKQVDGNLSPSDEQKLLKGLSQLSLARQFTLWETERGWKARADTLYERIQAARNGAKDQLNGAKCRGKISRFVRDHGYPDADHNVVRKGIQRGTMQMVFRRLLNDVFAAPEHNPVVEGLLALVTIFEYSLFQNISISELPILTNLLFNEYESNSNATASSSNDNLTFNVTSTREISQWFHNMSDDFEMISRNTKRVQQGGSTRRPGALAATGQGQSCQPDVTVFPNINSHELASFSTVPSNAPNGEEIDPSPNETSHDLAHFSIYTSCNSTGNSVSPSGSHGPSPPRDSAAPNHDSYLFVGQSLDLHNATSTIREHQGGAPHELSSFSTFPV